MSKKEKSYILIGIIILIIILIFRIYFQSNNKINIDSQKINITIDNSKLNIFYFYVGQADCTLIMNKGQVMLIDAGEDTDGELNYEYLESIQVSMFSFFISFVKTIEKNP